MSKAIKKIKEIINSPVAELGAGFLDSIETAPFGSIVIAGIKVGFSISDYLFLKRFADFLEPMSGMENEVDAYLKKLSSYGREKHGEYMLTLLSKAETSEKAEILGMIFRSAVLEEIDNETMLRLVSIVGRSFVPDLKDLSNYITESDYFSDATNEFINLGLIDNETGGSWKNNSAVKLNETGEKLYYILKEGGWFSS